MPQIIFIIAVICATYLIIKTMNTLNSLNSNKKLIKAYDDLIEAQKKENDIRMIQVQEYQNLVAAQVNLIAAVQKELVIYREIVDNIEYEQIPASKLN